MAADGVTRLQEIRADGKVNYIKTVSGVPHETIRLDPDNSTLSIDGFYSNTGTAPKTIELDGDAGSGAYGRITIYKVQTDGSTSTPQIDLDGLDGIASKPGGGSWSALSDRRVKKDVKDMSGALDSLLALRGVTFKYQEPQSRAERPGTRLGMIAQEVEAVFPDWVDTGSDGYKRLTFRGFEAVVVEAVRELKSQEDRQIASQQAKIDSLEKRLAALEHRLTTSKTK